MTIPVTSRFPEECAHLLPRRAWRVGAFGGPRDWNARLAQGVLKFSVNPAAVAILTDANMRTHVAPFPQAQSIPVVPG